MVVVDFHEVVKGVWMKALVVEAPGIVRLTEVDDVVKRQGETLLQVRMVGLCGTDLNTFLGKNPMVRYPRVIGHEVAATVLEGAVGQDGHAVPAGTDVTISPYTSCGSCPSCKRKRFNACKGNETLGVQRDGALVERISVPAEKLYTASLSLQELCLVEPLTVGFHSAARGRVSKDDTVAVFGCGGVGLGAIAAAAFRGARTIAIDMDDAKLEIARRAGATELIHAGAEDLHARLAAITGSGPDCIIEAIGLPSTFRAAVEEVAFTGRVVYIGYAREPVCYETKLFVQKELDIMGSRNAMPDDFRDVISMLEEKRFPVADAISVVAPIEEAPDLLRQWSEDPARFTKIMIQVS
jgi:threonine dehydrogenase-like Zn-dependent dehydrogenase